MQSRKIITDEADNIFKPSKRKKINSALVLTGGGSLQTIFAMGAVGCLVDNKLFGHDLITAVSGGALLLLFIDLCFNPTFKYASKPGWYGEYVRKPMYAIATAKPVAYFVKSGFDLQKTQDYIFKTIPEFNKEFTHETVHPICEYNYINGNTYELSCDHTDVIDLKNAIKRPYWWLVRPARCGLPFCNFYNKPVYDAGNISNIPVTSLLTRYSPKRVIIIKARSLLTYDNYPDATYVSLLTGWLLSNIASAETNLNNLVDLSLLPNDDNIICSISNGLNKSQDMHHHEMFDDAWKDHGMLARLYNGLLYVDEDVMKIIENEGYIQMYHQLKRTKEAKTFKIPNPEVYNKNAKKIIQEWRHVNVLNELIRDIIGIKTT